VFATGSLRHGALRKLAAIGVDGNASVLVTASEFVTREDIVSQAIEQGKARYGVKCVERIVSFGDGLWDLKTARTLGYEFIGIGDGEKARRLVEAGAPVFRDFIQACSLNAGRLIP
jgi:phosphoglycolate phosphatase-like HAD superfamily hydrolase